MPQHTVVVFQWSGTHYNAQYNTSHTATFDDDDGAYEGGADTDESISIDGGAFESSDHQPYSIDVSFTDTSGGSHVETFNFFMTDGNWYFTPGPDSEFTVGATLGSYQSHTTGWNYEDIVCLTRGTLVETSAGPVAVENLRPGDQVCLAGGGTAPLRLALSRRISGYELARQPSLRPVRLMAGAMGGGLPMRDLLVSRQHRMVVKSRIAKRMFGQDEVLVAAIRLTELPGIFIDEQVGDVEYFHLVFDRHEVIFAEGSATESLYFGAQTIKSLRQEARAEITALFPEINTPGWVCQAALMIPPLAQQKRLARRHAKNRQDLHNIAHGSEF